MLYADDAALVQSDNNLGNLRNLVNREITKVMVELTTNKLSLNISKTKYVLITNKHANAESFAINSNGCRTEGTLISKHLVVIANEKLTCKEFCKQLCRTISKYACVMHKPNHYINSQTILCCITA